MLAEKEYRSELDKYAKDLLMREAYDPSYGARPLKRAIQTYIQNPLAVKLLQGEVQPGQVIKLSANGDNIEFKQDSVVAAA